MSRIGTLVFAAIVLLAAGCTDDYPTSAPPGASAVAPGGPTRAPNATILSSRTVSAIQLSVAERHSCALESDNSAVCWGSLDTEPSLSRKYSWVAAGEESDCGIRVSDGGIECWRGSAPGIPTGTFTRLSVGNGHACAIRTDKTLACWWGNDYGEALPPAGTYVDVDAGGDHTCAVATDGTHTCWGRAENSDLDPASGPPVTQWPGVVAGVGRCRAFLRRENGRPRPMWRTERRQSGERRRNELALQQRLHPGERGLHAHLWGDYGLRRRVLGHRLAGPGESAQRNVHTGGIRPVSQLRAQHERQRLVLGRQQPARGGRSVRDRRAADRRPQRFTPIPRRRRSGV